MAWDFPEYPENWDKIRKQVYERDNYTCRLCRAKDVKLYAHHIVSKSKGGSDNLENLVSLCEECHIKQHPHLQRQRDKRKLEYLIRKK